MQRLMLQGVTSSRHEPFSISNEKKARQETSHRAIHLYPYLLVLQLPKDCLQLFRYWQSHPPCIFQDRNSFIGNIEENDR